MLPGVVAAVAGAFVANLLLRRPRTGPSPSGTRRTLFALLVFVVVGSTVSSLVDRVARRSAEAVRARADAEALARSALVLATDPDPLPTAGRGAPGRAADWRPSSVLQLDDPTTGPRSRPAGERPPASPGDGVRHTLTEDGRTVAGAAGPPARCPGLASCSRRSPTSWPSRSSGASCSGEAAAAAVAGRRPTQLRTGILQAVSHDLRTPLAGIKASVTSLLSDDVTFGARRHRRRSCARSTTRSTGWTGWSATSWT